MEEIASISEVIGFGLLLFDEELKVCHANTRAGEILDIPLEDLLGRPLDEIDALLMNLHGQPISAEKTLRQSVSQKRRLLDAEFILQQKNAPPIHISLNASPHFHPDGRIKNLVVDFSRCCRSGARLHQFIGVMDEIVFEFDAEGRYLNIWTENEELLKVPSRELYGRRFQEVIPKELADTFSATLLQVQASGKPKTLEYPLEVQGGNRWFLARIALVPPVQGGEPTFSFLARDITELKQLEQTLRASESRFRGLFDNAAMGIALVNPDGRCLDTNECLRDMLGYSAEELRQQPFSSYSHPAEVEADLAQFARLLRGEIKTYRMEKRFFRKDGKVVWGHLTIALQRDEEGKPLYSIAMVENITARKRIETEREQLLGELEAIFASAGDGIIFYDRQGNILRLNDAAKAILGYSNEMLELSLAERYRQWARKRPDGTVLPLEETALFRVFQGEATKGMIVNAPRPDGKNIWISLSASPVVASGGWQIGAVLVLTDITSLRELQDRHEDYLHMLAHDLRSPLTVIAGYAELLQGMLRESPQREALESTQAIRSAADHMNSMMEDLVEVARLESGQAVLHDDVICLDDFLGEFLKRQISSDFQRVRAEIPASLHPVRMGKDHLERALGNVLGNALKYSAPELPVEVGACRAEGRICLTVKDYGPGIAPEDLPRIFERFFRTASAKSSAGGTGMGLYITRKLLELYGGSIRVESKIDQGSTFTLCLPETRA